MLNNKKIIAIIPARGGSKGIPRKNIKLLAGKPLIAYSIEQAKQSKFIDRVIVSTEDKEIAEIAKKFGAEVQIRPQELAEDNVATPPVLQYVVKTLEKEGYEPDIIVLLPPTSPLRRVSQIDEGLEKMKEGNESVLSYGDLEINPICIFEIDKNEKPLINYNGEARRQKVNKFVFNGAVYIYNKEVLMQLDKLLWPKTNKIGLIKMSREESLEIDEPLDFEFIENFIKKNSII